MQINLNAVASVQGGPECGHGIFRDTFFQAMISTVGEHRMPIAEHIPFPGETRQKCEKVQDEKCKKQSK